MAAQISSEVKGSRHVSVSHAPREHQGAHPSIQTRTDSITDQRIAADFLAAFRPYEPVVPQAPENYETVVVPAPEKPPERYTLPARTILIDEDGNEIHTLSQDTDVEGEWRIRPPRGRGPAIFDVSIMYLDGKKVPLRTGVSVPRRGLLWNGQRATDVKKKPR